MSESRSEERVGKFVLSTLLATRSSILAPQKNKGPAPENPEQDR
jgi:hypothetical protein